MNKTVGLNAGISGVRIPGRGKCLLRSISVHRGKILTFVLCSDSRSVKNHIINHSIDHICSPA